MPGNNGDPTSVGTELLKDLVSNLVLSNRNADLNRELLVEIRDVVDDLVAELFVVRRAFAILREGMDGKRPMLGDIMNAFADAEDEVFGDDEDGDGGDPEPEPVAPRSGRAD